MFYDIFVDLCKSKGVKPTPAALEIGLNRSTVTGWKKNGSVPTGEVLEKVSAYFGVSTDFLLGKEQPEKTTIKDEDLMFALWGPNRRGITQEELEDVRAFAQFIADRKKKQKEADDKKLD